MNPIAKDPFQKRLEISNWIVLAAIFVPILFFTPLHFALGVLIGGLISIVNYFWMERSLRGIFRKDNNKVKGSVLLKYYLRLIVTAVVLFFVIRYQTVHVIGLLIGLSVVVINIVVTLIISLSKKNSFEEA